MVQNVINNINTWQDWYNFTNQVENSESYKHGWFVVALSFNERPAGAKAPNEVCFGRGLTEAEAKKIYKANKNAVENCGTDYSEIWIENLYNPVDSAAPYVYERATGMHMTRAFELQAICEGVTKKFKAIGLLD